MDRAYVPFTVGELETNANQLNGRDRFVHHSSGSGQQVYMDPAGQCFLVHEQGSASSVGSVASSAKLSAAGNAVSRSSRCASSSSDINNSFNTAQHDEVLSFFLDFFSVSRTRSF